MSCRAFFILDKLINIGYILETKSPKKSVEIMRCEIFSLESDYSYFAICAK